MLTEVKANIAAKDKEVLLLSIVIGTPIFIYF
jgi:hypothetical protein